MTKDLHLKQIISDIWFSPRKTFQTINEIKYSKYGYLILILLGVLAGIEKNTHQIIIDIHSFFILNGIIIFFTSLITIISFIILAYILNWTAKFLDGKGSTSQILNMSTYAMIPAITAIPFMALKILLFNNQGQELEQFLMNLAMDYKLIYFILEFFIFLLGLWSFILIIIGISEVQKFSIFKAILNLIIPVLMLISIFGLIIYTFSEYQNFAFSSLAI